MEAWRNKRRMLVEVSSRAKLLEDQFLLHEAPEENVPVIRAHNHAANFILRS